ncbi:hypothetical protein P9213_01160 [Geobacillus stearothermophilus]|uniref:hypothetical protein n=1 Tax=Geobacillus stearothermophilus TaxID=1422 RepID=UPI002E22326B|nr:hypothetical protein [Geobacillus stearothermophilus]MED4355350.1 hypothetical protein [Geobacillus stearothermophilus]
MRNIVLFRENPTLVSGDFHARVEGKTLPMDLSVKMRRLDKSFSCQGGEQGLLMDVFCENNESMSGYFHAWVASKSLLMDVLCVMI